MESLKLEDIGTLLEGKLIEMEDVWYLVDVKGKHHKLDDVFNKFKNQDVRITVANTETLNKIQEQLMQAMPNMQGSVQGLSREDIVKRLKQNS